MGISSTQTVAHRMQEAIIAITSSLCQANVQYTQLNTLLRIATPAGMGSVTTEVLTETLKKEKYAHHKTT